MSLLRLIYNALALAIHAARITLYGLAWIGASSFVVMPIMAMGGLMTAQSSVDPIAFYLPLVIFGICRKSYRYLKPKSRPRLLRGPAAPPPPLPKASVTHGRADDPSEAMVIGRLDPKLRDLLRPKAESATTT